MNIFLGIVIVLLVIMVVVSLVRGLVAFMQSTKLDLEAGEEGLKRLQLRQNQMMFARIKYQALAVLAVAVLLVINS